MSQKGTFLLLLNFHIVCLMFLNRSFIAKDWVWSVLVAYHLSQNKHVCLHILQFMLLR